MLGFPYFVGPDFQGSFPAGTPGNGVPKVILTVGTANGVPRNAIVR